MDHPKFVQIVGNEKIIYGLDKYGEVWSFDDLAYQWRPIKNRR